MSKLKEKIGSLYLTFRKSIERFPVTIITIIILTLLFVINIEEDIIKENLFRNITFFGMAFANGAFLVESLAKEKIKKIGYIFPIFFASIYTYIFAMQEAIEILLPTNMLNWIGKLFVCCMISFFALAIYFNYKRSTKTFEQYVTSVFVNIFKTTIIYGILAIGSAIITAIFIYLILDGGSYTLLARIEVLILGIYYIPAVLYSLYNIEEKTSKFSKVVIKYVLGTLVILAFAIIYMYIIKIIILRDMPSNQIFRILATLFILGCPIWTMSTNFKENTLIDKINRLLPKLFIPFIFLQIYSIGVRILDNGITENRYLCVMLIIFEIIYIIMNLRKSEKLGKMILVFVALTIISIIVPYINMYKVSQISQYNNLKIFKEKTQYTEKEKQKIYGAYDYLQGTDEGDLLIRKLLSENEEEEVKNILGLDIVEKYNMTKYLTAYTDVNYIDVSEYKNLYAINLSNYSSSQGTIEEVFGNLELSLKNNQTIYVNISNKINEYIQYGYNLKNNFENINKIQIDYNKTLILTDISISYDRDSRKVEDYRLRGYLLEAEVRDGE